MSLTKVKNAFMFLHVLDIEQEINNLRGFCDGHEKKDNINKLNVLSNTIFRINK
jgi:hypothetical protein